MKKSATTSLILLNELQIHSMIQSQKYSSHFSPAPSLSLYLSDSLSFKHKPIVCQLLLIPIFTLSFDNFERYHSYYFVFDGST